MLREYRGKVASSTRGKDAVNGSILLGSTVHVRTDRASEIQQIFYSANEIHQSMRPRPEV